MSHQRKLQREIAKMRDRSGVPDEEVFAEFAVTFLTEVVNVNPRDNGPATQRGLVTYRVFAQHAEDAILRLRESAPIEHPIIEIAAVQNTGNLSTNLILPKEWEVSRKAGLSLVEH